MRSAKILAVDDEPDFELLLQQRFRRQIRERQFAFRFARHGEEALAALAAEPDIDLMLLDINMPVMDGPTLLLRLREQQKNVKAIIVSAYGDMANLRTAMNRGAFDFVTKPVDLNDLEITMQKALDDIDRQRMLVAALRATEGALRRERELKTRMDGELAAARAIQLGLLPRGYPAFPERPDIDLSARLTPARTVAGDFYDYLLIDNDRRLFFMIADVSDKGVPAALFMALTKEIVHDAVLRFAPSLDRILREVNRRTTAAGLELPSQGGDMMFVTAFAGILDLANGDIAFASAGHDLPFVVGGNRGLRKLATEGGPPLGAIDPFQFPIERDRLAPGEVLLLYTDGVTEAQNAEHALYSADRLERLLRAAPAAGAERLVEAIAEDVGRFVSGAEQADDITLLALRRVPR